MESIWYGRHPLRWVLWPASGLFYVIVALRRALYRIGVMRIVRLPVPVIVVGNLSVGGTGKTPCTIWLARALQAAGYKVGIVSRGYRGQSRTWPRIVDGHSDPVEVGDEPALIARRTGCAVAVGPDRVAAACLLLQRSAIDVLIADDGLQHYRLGRDFELVVVDGERGLGNGWCLPAGPLREPVARLEAANAILVNGSAWVGPGRPFRAQLRATGVHSLRDGRALPLEAFRGKAVRAVAGIGHPQRFFSMLTAAGLEVAAYPLADHGTMDLSVFTGADPVLMTEKDAIKYAQIDTPEVWYVAVEFAFTSDDEARLLELVQSCLRG